MAPRLFLGNFDFEHRLADPRFQPTKQLKRLNAELATAWLAIAEEGDWIWTPEPIDAEFFRSLENAGFPRVQPVVSLSDVPSGVECVPWGWSSEVRLLAEKHDWIADAPPILAVQIANSRTISYVLERLLKVGLDGMEGIRSMEQLHAVLESQAPTEGRWVIKAEYGMSARERILGRGRSLSTADEQWVRKRLDSRINVYFEPWVERVGEIGIQIDVLANGRPQLLGITPMLVDERGQYAGSWFAYQESRFSDQQAFWPSAIETALEAARQLKSQGYFGPLGIDAMIYRDSDGELKLRPLQDINARWTMGRLSLGWQRFLEHGEEGCWLRGSCCEDPAGFQVTSRFRTTPDTIGGTPSNHESQLIFGCGD